MFQLEECPNLHTFEMFSRINHQLSTHNNIMVAISGGSDSDIMLDAIIRVCHKDNISMDKIHFVFFNTGIEYQATKNHLVNLEKHYNIIIKKPKIKTPVPLGCKKYGVPFLSKYISDMIHRLQINGFLWEDESYEELIKKYPKCKTALQWWCNNNGDTSHFNINKNIGLKEFMINNPPAFAISPQCCNGAKKYPSHQYVTDNKIDMVCLGIRKDEGGIRSTTYKSCFDNTVGNKGYDTFRPIFWITDKEKEEYKEYYDVQYSDCYNVYGLKRTGCVGCPFGSGFEFELNNVNQYEPKLYNAVNNIFGKSYDYVRKYQIFKQQYKSERN